MKLGLVTVVLVAILATLVPATTAGARNGLVRPCRSTQLLLTTASAGAGAGTSYTELIFVNLGAPCSLHGYPGVSAVRYGNAGPIQIGPPAGRGTQADGGAVPRTVLLARRGVASSILSQASPGNFPPARCKQRSIQAFRVYPPGERVPLFVSASGYETACRRVATYGIGPVVGGIPHALPSTGAQG